MVESKSTQEVQVYQEIEGCQGNIWWDEKKGGIPKHPCLPAVTRPLAETHRANKKPPGEPAVWRVAVATHARLRRRP